MPGLNKSSTYRNFIDERDKALERLLRNSNLRITDYTSATLREIEAEVSLLLHRRAYSSHVVNKELINQLDQRLSFSFHYLGMLISREIDALLRRTYALSTVGEAEAIARTVGNATYKVEGKDSKKSDSDRIIYNLNTLRYKILKSFELGLVLEDTDKDLMDRVKNTFPKIQKYKRPPRQLKTLKESNVQKKIDAASGFIDDSTWNDMLQDYLKEYVPTYKTRGPDSVFDIKQDSGEYEETYGWEIESEVNHAFVDQVRNGQHTIAKQNGYTDMVWIAILDYRTDECCEWRNGLTSKEIESRLSKDDEYDAIVPPCHINCRCSMAPYTEALGEPEKVDFTDFDEWLKNQ